MKDYSEKAKCQFFGLAIDATKVAKHLDVNTAYGVMCGEAAPNHARSVDVLNNDSIPQDEAMAAELKCAVVTVQDHHRNVSPFKIIAARPQLTNQRCDSFNNNCIKAVQDNGVLLSVAFDGLSAEGYTIRNTMLNFLEGKNKTVAMVDPNHVAKAIRSQLVLGGTFTTIGGSYFDVGLLQLSGVAKNLYRVDDFASDAVVLELCSKRTISKMEQEALTEDRHALIATAMSLLFLRLFVVVSSSSDIPKRQAIAIIWSCMLYFTSIDMSIVTKRNVVSAAIPIICLLAQKSVKKIRLLTSEPAEHYFGCTRQKKREFTVSDFVMYVESLEIALREMVEYNLRSGGGTGYVSTFSGFLSQCVSQIATENSSSSNEHLNVSTFEGVDVDYNDSTTSVASQIEEEVITNINTATESLVTFLRNGMGIQQSDISPFARTFNSFKALAHCYFFYLPQETREELSDHVYTNGASINQHEPESPLDNIDNLVDDLEVTDTLENAVSMRLQDNENNTTSITYKQFIPHGLQAIVENEAEEVRETNPSHWKTLTNVMKLVVESRLDDDPNDPNTRSLNHIFDAASVCMSGAKQAMNVSTSDMQKYNSLKGRWWGKSESIRTDAGPRNHIGLKRGLLFYHKHKSGRSSHGTTLTYKILNVFGKSYNKWRIEEYLPATKQTKVQAVAVVQHRFIEDQYEIDLTCDRKARNITLNGDQVVPIAIINSHGWISSGKIV